VAASLNGNGKLRGTVAGSVATAVLAGGGAGVWQFLDTLSQLRAEQAVDRSMILNHASRMDAMEIKIEEIRSRLRELERGKP